jgi:hypothetical protein
MGRSITKVSFMRLFNKTLLLLKIKERTMSFNKGIFVAFAIIYLCIAFYTIFTYKDRLREDGVRYFFYFTLSYASWFILLILRHIIPDFFSIVFANTFAAIGTIFLYLTVRTMVGLEHEWHHRYLIPILLIFIASIIYTYFIFSIKMRFFAYSSFFAFYYGLIAWIFYTFKPLVFELFEKFSFFVFFIGFLIFFGIALYSLFLHITPYLFGNSIVLTSLFGAYMLFLSIWSALALKSKLKTDSIAFVKHI